MLSLVLREFKSKINRENIKKFFGQENWWLYFYFLVGMPFFSESGGNQLYLIGMGIAICISRWLLFVIGNELPTVMYFCPITETERRQYFRKTLILRTVFVFLLCLGILGSFSFINSSDNGGGMVGVLFVCVSILPLVIRSGVDLENEREKKLVSCDTFGSTLMICGYFVIFALGELGGENGKILDSNAFHTSTVVANLVNTLWGKIVMILMFALIAFYFYYYYPKIESYVVDYERVQAVREQKQKKYQSKRRKTNRA